MNVSVIVPIYNVEPYLRQCLESLRVQTMKDIEVICVNDGSTDGSLKIIQEYVAKDNRFKLIDKPNAGYGSAINEGIKLVRAPYFGILESDDFCVPTMFESLYQYAVTYDADVVRSNINLYWSKPEERSELIACAPLEDCNKIFDPRVYEKCFYFPPALWSMLIRKEVVTNNSLLLSETPGASYQDTAFSFVVWACACTGVIVPDALIFYRQDNEASSINQRGKVFCVPDEYQKIEAFLRSDLSKFEELLPVMVRRKYEAYAWNYSRISSEYHLEFAERASVEFAQAKKQGILDSGKFTSDEWTEIETLIRDPKKFLALKDRYGKVASFAYYSLKRVERGFASLRYRGRGY